MSAHPERFELPLTMSPSKGERPAKDRLVEGCALRVLCVPLLVGLIVASTVACGTNPFRRYEYEEEVYLSLDGRATVYVNSSLAALNALRGTSFDASPNARVDTAAVRRYYSSASPRVTR